MTKYWLNWTYRVTKRPGLINEKWTDRCFNCKKNGVLGVDLIFRGKSKTKNLLCEACFAPMRTPIWTPPPLKGKPLKEKRKT